MDMFYRVGKFLIGSSYQYMVCMTKRTMAHKDNLIANYSKFQKNELLIVLSRRLKGFQTGVWHDQPSSQMKQQSNAFSDTCFFIQ